MGSHAVDFIMSQGNRVVCVDNLITGKKDNVIHHIDSPNFTYIEEDICNLFTYNGDIDYVLNYACPASPINYRKHARETMLACSAGVKNLLDLARQKNARFFHTSTSEVYGDPEVHPQSEGYWGNVNPYGERSCYDEGKRYAEALTYIYRTDFGVNTVIVRIFNTYGERMDPNDGRVVSTFIRQALEGEDLTIFGDGSQTRSFCYVDDQIEGQMRLIHSNEGGPINIGNTGEFTMLELAEEVLEQTGSASKIIYKPLPQDDPTQRKPDITLAREKLDWQPSTSLREGLKKTINWYKKEKGA